MEQLLLADDQMKRLTWEELTWLQLELEDGVLPDLQELRFIKEASISGIWARVIQMDSDNVTFYSNLMSEVDPDYRGLLQELIKEESQHIKWLTAAEGEPAK